jgi:hypothetical protein
MLTPLKHLAGSSFIAACLPARVDIGCLGYTVQAVHLLSSKINRERSIGAGLRMTDNQAGCEK